MSLNIFKNNHPAFFPTHSECALLLGICLLLVSPAIALAQEGQGGCGSLTQSWGPFDYRPDRYIPETTYGSHKALVGIVEGSHFTPEVEILVRGKTSASAGPDISYTLGVFPNHHRALIAMAALGEKEKTSKANGARYSVECYFRRAIAWRADDNIARMIYANYLAKAMRANEAEQQLSVVASQAGDNALTHNNIGLIYFDMKNYEKALFHAHRAYELGLGRPDLREQLKRVGKWSEPAEALPVEPAKNPQ